MILILKKAENSKKKEYPKRNVQAIQKEIKITEYGDFVDMSCLFL